MLIQKKLTILRFEGGKVICQLETGQEFALPKEDFPKTVREDEQFTMTIQPVHEAQLEKEELARTLLNEILSDDQTTSQSTT